MTPHEKEVYEGIKGKKLDDYTEKEVLMIISEVIWNAKNIISTNRAKVEAKPFENIICEATDSTFRENCYIHKYGELISCIENMTFIKRKMQPKSKKYFENAIKWLEINRDKDIDTGCYAWYMLGSHGNMFR